MNDISLEKINKKRKTLEQTLCDLCAYVVKRKIIIIIITSTNLYGKNDVYFNFITLKTKIMKLTKKYLDDLSYKVIGAAIEVHKELGPGLLESVYHKCLMHELTMREIKFRTELIIPINYKGLELDANLRLDLYIEDVLPLELKSTEGIAPIFEAQILSYMKLIEAPKGLLINFNVSNIVIEGQRTYVNELYRELDDA